MVNTIRWLSYRLLCYLPSSTGVGNWKHVLSLLSLVDTKTSTTIVRTRSWKDILVVMVVGESSTPYDPRRGRSSVDGE